jgi:hypothetical protein
MPALQDALTICAYYIRGAAKGAHLSRRSAEPAIDVTGIAQMPAAKRSRRLDVRVLFRRKHLPTNDG